MLRPAMADDFLALFKEHQHLVDDMSPEWGLKMMGNLYCHDLVIRHEPKVILEAGVGLSHHFHDRYASDLEYWAIDKAGFYDAKKFARAQNRRSKSEFVDGLLGSMQAGLRAASFDMTFSVSVLEHIPMEQIPAVCEDLFRITAGGGRTIHSIDVPLSAASEYAQEWERYLSRSGFVHEDEGAVVTAVHNALHDGQALFFEPLRIQYLNYSGVKDKWNPIRPVRDMYCTLLVDMQRPRSHS